MKLCIFRESVVFSDTIYSSLTLSNVELHFLRVLHFTNSGIIRFSENFVKFLTCDYSFQVYK